MKIFVYGTLKRGGVNHARLDGVQFLYRTTVNGILRLPISKQFPGVNVPNTHILAEGPNAIEECTLIENENVGRNFITTTPNLSYIDGEVFDVTSQEQLDSLDRLEGYRGVGNDYNFYKRVLVMDIYNHPAWIYISQATVFTDRVGEAGEIVSFTRNGVVILK